MALLTRPLDGSDKRPQALVTYIESMQKTREMPAEIVLSGHGDPPTHHAGLIDERIAKRGHPQEKLYELIAEHPASPRRSGAT
jgi:glyoxylase-like metal-dependent hydrolase (beta-lactamase superfamily II)